MAPLPPAQRPQLLTRCYDSVPASRKTSVLTAKQPFQAILDRFCVGLGSENWNEHAPCLDSLVRDIVYLASQACMWVCALSAKQVQRGHPGGDLNTPNHERPYNTAPREMVVKMWKRIQRMEFLI